MKAFYRYSEWLVKANCDGPGADWRITSNGRDYPETWASTWQDGQEGSLKRAIANHCRLNGILFLDNPEFLVICEEA